MEKNRDGNIQFVSWAGDREVYLTVIMGLEGLLILLVEWDLWNDADVKGLSVLNAGFHYFLGAYQV